MSYDVVIVGGGPAGASAAYFLKKGGAKVLVVEKKTLPRYKACAAGVPVAALKYFPFSFDRVIDRHIYNATFCYKNNAITQPIPKNCLTMTMRDKFDNFLLQSANVDIWDNKKISKVLVYKNYRVVKTQDGKSIKTRYVIGADGAGSIVGRSIGIKNNKKMGLALEVELPVPENILDKFSSSILVSFGVLTNGYFWIFPKKNHLSVGIGAIKNHKSLLRTLKTTMKFLSLPVDNIKTFAHPLPVHSGDYNIASHGVFLVGDAAFLVDPLTGEGIRHAILSGKIAAESILNSTEGKYPLKIKKQIGMDLLWAKRLADFFYKHQKFSFNFFVKNKFIFKDLMKIISNQNSYKKALFSVPFYFFLQNFFDKTKYI